MIQTNQGSFVKANKEKDDSISQAELYDKIPKLIQLIREILIDRLEKKEQSTLDTYLDKIPLGIEGREPYIMNEKDFDDVNFYNYILKCSVYFLKDKSNTFNVSDSILKHLIDLCNVLEILLKDVKNYEEKEVKYYLYHLISVFSRTKEKLGDNYKFLRCGLILLLKKFEIKDFIEYFPKESKDNMRKKLSLFLVNLVKEIYQYMIDKEYYSSFDRNKEEIYRKMEEINNKKNDFLCDKSEMDFLKNIYNFLYELSSVLHKDNKLDPLHHVISYFCCEIPDNINEFYYIDFCCKLKKDNLYYHKKFNQIKILKFLRENALHFKFMDDLFNYYYKFKKYNFKLLPLFEGENSNEVFFKEIIEEQDFREQILNFYKSYEIKKFIDDCCDPKETDGILSKLLAFCDLLKTKNFWNKIMFLPLTKHRMATVENFLRIVVNTEYITYIKASDDQKKTILRLVLFELLIHESFYLLRRLNFQSRNSTTALTPPNLKDKNELKSVGEIGERLIYYFFNVKKIVMVTYEAGQAFEKLSFKDKNDFNELKTILQKVNTNGLDETSLARFTNTIDNGMIIKIDDCRNLYVSKFNY